MVPRRKSFSTHWMRKECISPPPPPWKGPACGKWEVWWRALEELLLNTPHHAVDANPLIGQPNLARLVHIIQSPHMTTLFGHHPIQLRSYIQYDQYGHALNRRNLVYFKQDKGKTKNRDRYMITLIADSWCTNFRNQFRHKLYDVRVTDCVALCDLHPHSPTIAQWMPLSQTKMVMYLPTTMDPKASLYLFNSPHTHFFPSHMPFRPPLEVVAPVPGIPSETPPDDRGVTQWRSRPPHPVMAPCVVPHDRPPDEASNSENATRDRDDAVKEDIRPSSVTEETSLRRTSRHTALPVHLQDYIMGCSAAMSVTLLHYFH